MSTSPPPSPEDERTKDSQDAQLKRTLSKWLRSDKIWTIQTPVSGVRIKVDAELLGDLKKGVLWKGDTLTTALDVWHCQHVSFNPSTFYKIRIANTFAYPSMEQAFGQPSDTPEHLHAIIAAASGFRYHARRDRVATLQSILSHEYLVIPVHLFDIHWAVAIVTNAHNLLPENRIEGVSPTYIYTLDSLRGNGAAQTNAQQVIRSWLMFSVNSFLDGNVQGTDIIEIQVVEPAIQPNGVDCGPYVHHHVDTFFQPGIPSKLHSHYTGGTTMMTGGDLRKLWRYPTALECRFTVASKILGELESAGQTP